MKWIMKFAYVAFFYRIVSEFTDSLIGMTLTHPLRNTKQILEISAKNKLLQAPGLYLKPSIYAS